MKLTDQQLETLLLKSFEHLDKVKETCKVVVSQCLQIDMIEANKLIKSCLETIDTAELCKMFIINRSPNIKNCIFFTMKVLKTNMEQCNKFKDNPMCKDTVKFCLKVVGETYKTLEKLHNEI